MRDDDSRQLVGSESVYRAAYREELEKLAELWDLNLTAYDWEATHE